MVSGPQEPAGINAVELQLQPALCLCSSLATAIVADLCVLHTVTLVIAVVTAVLTLTGLTE